jgi:site-specific DNA-methyltransferase (adenine-specific)
MAVNIEDAGFEIRDIVASIYGSGFPKSLDISKANGRETVLNPILHTEEAKQWQGFGTALKPAMELWTLARKPLKGTVAENVLKYGTGGLNIDGCRVETEEEWNGRELPNAKDGVTWGGALNKSSSSSSHPLGRFPANVIHDGSEEVVKLFPNTESKAGVKTLSTSNIYGGNSFNSSVTKGTDEISGYTDSGSAARFFYTAKASQSERNAGLYGFEEERHADRNKDDGVGGDNPRNRTNNPRKNFHPTVKPLDLMRYLCRLITPPNGIVLDPYLGSGTTAVAAKLDGFQYIGIEMEADYCKIAEARVANCDQDYNKIDNLLSQPGVVEVPTIFDFI